MAVAGGTVNKLLIYYNEIKFINFAGGEFRARIKSFTSNGAGNLITIWRQICEHDVDLREREWRHSIWR